MRGRASCGKVIKVLAVALAADEAVDGCGEQVHFSRQAVHGHGEGVVFARQVHHFDPQISDRVGELCHGLG